MHAPQAEDVLPWRSLVAVLMLLLQEGGGKTPRWVCKTGNHLRPRVGESVMGSGARGRGWALKKIESLEPFQKKTILSSLDASFPVLRSGNRE